MEQFRERAAAAAQAAEQARDPSLKEAYRHIEQSWLELAMHAALSDRHGGR